MTYGPCTCTAKAKASVNQLLWCAECRAWAQNRACYFDKGAWRDADNEPMPVPAA